MVKILIVVCSFSYLFALDELSCVECHKQKDIPDEIIYKRYLLKYSTKKYMKKAIFDYLKNPDKKRSIMPSIFFTKFPMKEPMRDENLSKEIDLYLEIYDLKKRLVLE